MTMHKINYSFDDCLKKDISKELHMLAEAAAKRDEKMTKDIAALDVTSLYPTVQPVTLRAGDLIGIMDDIRATRAIVDYTRCFKNGIKKVIFNDPATIIIWNNGDKTIVKCGEGETFDPEKGLAMAIAKRFLGDKGNYYDTFRKWLPKEEKAVKEPIVTDCKVEETEGGIKISGNILDTVSIENLAFLKVEDKKTRNVILNWCQERKIFSKGELREFLNDHPFPKKRSEREKDTFYTGIGPKRYEILKDMAGCE